MNLATRKRILRCVFKYILNVGLPGVTVNYPYAPVRRQLWNKCDRSRSSFFNAPGGTGRPSLLEPFSQSWYRADRKYLPVATSAIVSSLSKNRKRAYSILKMPISCFSERVCSISKDSQIACTIRQANLNIRDEIVVYVWYSFEAVNRTLHATMKSLWIPIGGKCILFSGVFRKILPVVPWGSRRMIEFMNSRSSLLFHISNYLCWSEASNYRLWKMMYVLICKLRNIQGI